MPENSAKFYTMARLDDNDLLFDVPFNIIKIIWKQQKCDNENL